MNTVEMNSEEIYFHLIEAARLMGTTAEEFIKTLNEFLEVLKRYGNK